MERERKRDSFGILYTGYLLSKIKREIIERERERKVWPKTDCLISRYSKCKSKNLFSLHRSLDKVLRKILRGQTLL